jgi:DME family drug/metabolite transporter
MVMLGVLSALFLKERVTPRKIGAVILTILGVSLLRAKSGEAGLTHAIILMMIFSGIGAAVHVFLQRRLVESMDSLNLNTSVFIAASLITLLPLPVLGHFTGQFSFAALFSLLGLGLITGLSFHLFALALRSVPIIRVTILSNVGFLFTPIWAWLAFSDPLSLRVLFGAALSISGIVLVSLPGRRALPPVD